jgi:hypothetical protein
VFFAFVQFLSATHVSDNSWFEHLLYVRSTVAVGIVNMSLGVFAFNVHPWVALGWQSLMDMYILLYTVIVYNEQFVRKLHSV